MIEPAVPRAAPRVPSRRCPVVGHAVAVDPAVAARNAMDIADDTFVVAAAGAVAELLRDQASWRIWWPDLALTLTRDQGLAGMHWSVGGAVAGSMEIWLESWGDGVIVHWYLRPAPARVARRPERERADRVLRWKRQVHALKDRLEADREPGSPRAGTGLSGVKDRAEPAESQ
jgi:hypothetical protein